MMNKAETAGRADLRHADLPIGDSENLKHAIQENGGPGDPGGSGQWHSRGYLPHFESAEKIQHVTFHLADSLPKSVLDRLEEELQDLPAEKQTGEKRKRLEAWMDAGYGACILRELEIARMVQGALLFFDGPRYRLLAWVIMPNHVHVLFQPLNGWTVAKIVASWKKYTARKIGDSRRAEGESANQESANQESANQEIGVPGNVWHREYWDRFIRDERHLQQAIEYIHQNPVKAGLVNRADEWQWSSAAGRADLPIGDSANIPPASRETGDPRSAVLEENYERS